MTTLNSKLSQLASLQATIVLTTPSESADPQQVLYRLGDNQPYFPPTGGSQCMLGPPKPLKYSFQHEIAQIIAGNSYDLFLTTNNEVYGVGSNQFGQLGQDPRGQYNYDTPIRIEVPKENGMEAKVKQIAGGIAGATKVLTESGTVYTCGELNGRPGDMRFGLQPIPAEYFNSQPVIYISSGGCVSVFITADGAVYSIGYNSNAEARGVTGHPKEAIRSPDQNSVLAPQKIESLWNQGVRAVSGSAGRFHCIIIDRNGHLYGWGCNCQGQLGIPIVSQYHLSPEHDSITPQRLLSDLSPDVKFQQVSCSWSHSLAVTVDGQVYSLGGKREMLFGVYGREQNIGVYGLMEGIDRPIESAHAGGGHSVLIPLRQPNQTTTVIGTCGSARSDQLGGGNIEKHNGHDYRKLIQFLTWAEVLATKPTPNPFENSDMNGSRRGVFSKSRYQEYQEESEEDDEESYIDEIIYVTIDYSDKPIIDSESGSQICSDGFDDIASRILESVEYKDATDGTKFHLIVSNHYAPVDLASFVRSFQSSEHGVALANMSGLTFVSCCLFAPTNDVIEQFVDLLKSKSALEEFALDQADVYSNIDHMEEVISGEREDDAMSSLCSRLVHKVSSLRSLSIEGVGNQAISALTEALLTQKGKAMGLQKLSIHHGNFDMEGAQLLSQVLQANVPLQELRLPQHRNISDDFFFALVQGLIKNTHLQVLDVHVSELGHVGVGLRGLKEIIRILESVKRTSSLCAIDVSADDGEPNIPKKIQNQLTTCLANNANRINASKKLKKLARLPVYQCHEEEE